MEGNKWMLLLLLFFWHCLNIRIEWKVNQLGTIPLSSFTVCGPWTGGRSLPLGHVYFCSGCGQDRDPDAERGGVAQRGLGTWQGRESDQRCPWSFPWRDAYATRYDVLRRSRVLERKETRKMLFSQTMYKTRKCIFTSVGTTRGQGIIRVVVFVLIFWENIKLNLLAQILTFKLLSIWTLAVCSWLGSLFKQWSWL